MFIAIPAAAAAKVEDVSVELVQVNKVLAIHINATSKGLAIPYTIIS